MRVKAAKLTKKNRTVEWRSHEPSRLETFSDAVFAFAVTLIIVSLEVPKTFADLYETMKGTVSFAVCFAILFSIWNNQNIFFRCYGLNDSLTVTLKTYGNDQRQQRADPYANLWRRVCYYKFVILPDVRQCDQTPGRT